MTVPLAFQTPALPLHKAGPYVAAAYIVFVALILLYVSIMAVRLKRNQRELLELRAALEERVKSEQTSDAQDAVGTPVLPR